MHFHSRRKCEKSTKDEAGSPKCKVWQAFACKGYDRVGGFRPLSHHRTCHLWHTAVSNQRLRS